VPVVAQDHDWEDQQEGPQLVPTIMLGSTIFAGIRERLAAELQFLPDKPEETAESTARALWWTASGRPVSAEEGLVGELPVLDADGLLHLERLIQQRLDGVPLAYITGRQRFMGMEMLAGPEALVPRKETELVARLAVDMALATASEKRNVRVLDVCTGSGNIALAVACFLPTAQVYGADLSESAVALANRNAAHLGLHDRIEFRVGDLLAPFDESAFLGNIDVLTCNPPYIASAKVGQMQSEISAHEPKLAFDGGPFGVGILMRFLEEAPRFVRTGGWVAMEVGLGQGPGLAKRMAKNPAFRDVREVADDTGAARAILAQRA
jgi:release factor glutamine methyltransferase